MSAAWVRQIELETFQHERHALPTRGELAIGRTKDGALTLAAAPSRVHCVLVSRGRGWRVEDRNSSSGTWLNGHRITRARLRHGDVIDLYGTLLVFLERAEHHEPALVAAIDRTPDDQALRQVWADRLLELGDPLGTQLASGVVDPSCLEGLDSQLDSGRLELAWRQGLVEHVTLRCTSDSTFQDVDLLGRLLSLRVCRWVRSLAIDLSTWALPAQSRLQSDAAAALRGLLSGPELPALERLSFGYLSTPLPPSHFREALLDRLPARFPRLRTSPREVLPVVRHAWLEPLAGPAGVTRHAADAERGPIALHTGVWVGLTAPGVVRAIAPGVVRPGLREIFLVRQEAPQFCLVPAEHGVTLNGRPAVASRLLPGDVIGEPRGLRFRFDVQLEPPRMAR